MNWRERPGTGFWIESLFRTWHYFSQASLGADQSLGGVSLHCCGFVFVGGRGSAVFNAAGPFGGFSGVGRNS